MSRISENIKYLRKQSGLTQEQFANKIGIKRSLVGSYEEARAEPKLHTLTSIADALEVSTDALIKDDLTKGSITAAQKPVKILSITVDDDDQENIELVPQKAAAGYLNGYSDPEYVADLPRFKLPMLPKNGTYRAFEIHGDSMLPLPSGAIIIGRYLESVSEIKNGSTYVLLTQQEGVVYKRVFNYIEENGKLFLVSDNKSYTAYEIDPATVEEIWEAKAYISIQLPNPNDADDISIERLTELVLGLQKDVQSIKNGMTSK